MFGEVEGEAREPELGTGVALYRLDDPEDGELVVLRWIRGLVRSRERNSLSEEDTREEFRVALRGCCGGRADCRDRDPRGGGSEPQGVLREGSM